MNAPSAQQRTARGLLYAVLGVALFAIGGLVLEDAFGGDGLTFVGLVCLGSGLVGIIAGGVSVGSST